MDDATCYVFAIPYQDDPIWRASSENPPHATILYLPMTAFSRASELISSIFMDPFSAKVASRGELGDNKADVLFLGESNLSVVRETLLSDPEIREAFDSIPQYEGYTPHVTLGYPETPALGGDISDVIEFDRLAVMESNDKPDGEIAGMIVELSSEPNPMAYDEFTIDPIPVYGVLTVEGVETGDLRFFNEGSLTWETPPIALRFQERDAPGHDGSITTGTIEQIWREGKEIRFNGHMLLTEDADKMAELLATGAVRGISVDLDSAVMVSGDDNVNRLTYGRIRSASVLPMQAYVEAWIKIGSWDGNV